VFHASLVTLQLHLRADVVLEISAGKAHADVPSGEHVGQVMQHEEVAEEGVAEADEVRGLLVAAHAAAPRLGQLLGRKAEGMALRHKFNLTSSGTLPRGAEVLGKGRTSSVSNCIGRETDANRAGLEEGREVHPGRNYALPAHLKVRKRKRVTKSVAILKIVRKDIEHDRPFNDGVGVVAAELQLTGAERGNDGKFLGGERKEPAGLIIAANDESFNQRALVRYIGESEAKDTVHALELCCRKLGVLDQTHVDA